MIPLCDGYCELLCGSHCVWIISCELGMSLCNYLENLLERCPYNYDGGFYSKFVIF